MPYFPHYFTWSDQPTSERFPVLGAQHDEFHLQDGRRVYDFLSTSFQTNFGHSHTRIQQAIHRQLDAMPIASPKASFPLKERCSQSLVDLVGLGGGKIFYTVSGSESVENALKMARQITGRPKVAARRRSYHGASLGALSVTGDWRNAPHYTWDELTVRIPEPTDDPELTVTRRILTEASPESVAAVILETITGANGVFIPTANWFDSIQALCREFDMLLILDEVLCGFGRTGPAFAFQHYADLEPDFVCMSKGISGGYIPFGAVWTSDQVAAYYASDTLTCGLTNYAHPLGLAATQAVMELLDEDEFLLNKSELEQLFADWMMKLSSLPHVKTIRCKGLLAAIELHQQAPPWEAWFSEGLHLFSKQNMIVLAPPLISTPQRLGEAFQSLVRTLKQ